MTNSKYILAINCTEPPFFVKETAIRRMNWTEVQGNPRPYATVVEYSCPKKDWGFPSTGLDKVYAGCQANGTWNITSVDECISELYFVYGHFFRRGQVGPNQECSWDFIDRT